MDQVDYVKVMLIKESSIKYENSRVSHPEDAAQIARDYLGLVDREHFIILILNTKNCVTAITTVSVGSLNASIVHPREVFKAAILGNASGIIAIHNHPSGDTTPSTEDYHITDRLIAAGKLLDIPLLDHVVIDVESDRFTSILAKGACKF